jgi:hypothetical protein
MRRKEQRSMLALVIIMAFVVGVFWAGPVCAGPGQKPVKSPAAVEKTGQEESYAIGDDGDLQKGVVWPEPRFTDNEDGTVTDNLTGLMWAEDASVGPKNWNDALTYCNDLSLGGYGDWRLPNVKELQSLIHYGVFSPALPNTEGTDKWSEGNPFSVVSYGYWSSTTDAYFPDRAWFVYLNDGTVYVSHKDLNIYYVWPVRGGQ